MTNSVRTAVIAAAIASIAACSPSLGEPVTRDGCQLYHTPDVSSETATTVLEFLVSEGFCAGEGRRVQLATKADALELRIATRPEVRAEPAYLDLARAFAAQLSGKALDGRPVDVAICDEDLRVLTRAEGFRWGVHVALDACGLYVGGDVSPALGERFLGLVKEDLGCVEGRSFRLAREGDSLNLYFVLDDSALKSQDTFHQARLTAGRASRVLFDDAPITVHLADVYYVSRRSTHAVSLGPMVTRGACTVFQGAGLDSEHLGRFMGFIDRAGFCRDEAKVYRLSHEADGWHLAVVIRNPIPPSLERAFKTAFGLIAAMLRGGVFDLAPTSIDLCDPVFETCTSIVGPDLGKAFLVGTCSVFHDPTIEASVLSRFRRWLGQERFCEGPEQLLRLRRDGEGWAFHLAVRAQVHGSQELETLGKRITGQLSEKVFDGQAVRFVGTDGALLPVKGPAAPLPGAP